MMIPILATIVRALWIIVEYPYLRRFKVKPLKDWDRNSAKLWDIANAIEPVGMILGFTSAGRIHLQTKLIGALGLALLLARTTIPWSASYTLRNYCTAT